MIFYTLMIRRFLVALGIIGASIFLLVFLSEFQSKLSSLTSLGASNGEVAWLSAMITPIRMHRLIPMIFAIAALWMSVRTLLSHEYTIVRACGSLGSKALLFPSLAAFAVGVIMTIFIGPLTAYLAKSHAQQIQLLKGQRTEVFVESGGNVWFRQVLDGQQTILRAARTDQGVRFEDVNVYIFDDNGQPSKNILAESAELVDDIHAVAIDNLLSTGRAAIAEPGMCLYNYKLSNFNDMAMQSDSNVQPKITEVGCFASSLTAEQIGESFDPHFHVSLWRLPKQIKRLEFSGFSATNHKMHLQMESANPFLLAAMVLIGGGFTLRHRRHIQVASSVLLAVISSLSVVFLREFARIAGEVESINFAIAAWGPVVFATVMAIVLLSYQESR